MADHDTSDLGKSIQEVSEKVSLLVREELALAQAELSEKVSGLAKGIGVGVAAGVFVLAGLIYFLHFLALLIWQLLDNGGTSYWIGYLIVAVVLFVFGAVAGFLAARFVRKGTPPMPQMAIEEAQLIMRRSPRRTPARRAAPSSRPRRRRWSRDDRPLAGGDPALDRGQPRGARHGGRAVARRGHPRHGLARAAAPPPARGDHRRGGDRLRGRRRHRGDHGPADRPPPLAGLLLLSGRLRRGRSRAYDY